MKIFGRILSILLLGFILASMWEIFFGRDVKLDTQDPLNSLVEENGGWSGLLGRAWRSDDGSEPRGDTQENRTIFQDASSGEYTFDQLDVYNLSNNLSKYVVIEFCDHLSELCNEAFDKGTHSHLRDLVGGADAQYIRKPFLASVRGINELIRKGESCVPDVEDYHNNIYTLDNYYDLEVLDRTTVLQYAQQQNKYFVQCTDRLNNYFSITNQMKQTRNNFGITKIPSYLILNTQEQNRHLIPGLYTEDEVEEYVDREGISN